MNCLDVISDPPLVLRRDDKVADALEKMLEARLTSVPVTDGKGRYIGMFRVRRVIGLALPKAATVDHLVDDISYLHEDLADLTRHLDSVRNSPVGKHIDESVPSLKPDMQISEVLLRLYRVSNTLPVVEQPSGKLLGIITSQRILTSLMGND